MYKALYKDSRLSSSGRHDINANREQIKRDRAKKREEVFQLNRQTNGNKSPLPTNANAMEHADIKENENPLAAPECTNGIADPIDKKISSRRQQYLDKFHQWRLKKAEKRTQKKPASAAPTTTSSTKFEHLSKNFKPPLGLKQVQTNETKNPSNRNSLYVFVENGNKTATFKPQTVNPPTTTATNQKAIVSSKANQKPSSSTTCAKKTGTVASKPVLPVKTKVTSGGAARTEPATVLRTQITKVNAGQPPMPAKSNPKRPITNPNSVPIPINAIKSKPSAIIVKPVTTRTKQPAAAAIIKRNPNPRPPVKSFVPPTLPNRGGITRQNNIHHRPPPAALAVPLKAKKCNKESKLNTLRSHPEIFKEIVTAVAVASTPLEPHHNGEFQNQASSTMLKPSHDIFDYGSITKLSPISTHQPSRSSSAKRMLLPPPEGTKQYNFVRYSEADSLLHESPKISETLVPAVKQKNSSDETDDVTLKPPQTPPPQPPSSTEAAPNYLSPFVSVSRGKVNSRSEREKRNSMYIPEEEDEKKQEIKRTLQAVSYFRLQLQNELNRLNGLCDEWEAYKRDNESRLLDTGHAMDMINVAVGQTKLLTGKKLMQFSSLVDRCEAGATGIGLVANDGSEDTKPVQEADLQGWWDMVKLQSDNVDKRFHNLDRWKTNDWIDPDAAIVVEKPKLRRVLKTKLASTKAKPSANIRQFLRKVHADHLKTKKSAENMLNDTATKESRQRTIVVRDRKSFSPSPTVLKVSTPRRDPGNALLKSAIRAAAEEQRRSIAASQGSPPVQQPPPPRRSILKTPGASERRCPRGVVFSAKKSVRRFKFTIDEGLDISREGELNGKDKLEDCEEDMSLENSMNAKQMNEKNNTAETPTYTLRNRRVKLRPSSEFM